MKDGEFVSKKSIDVTSSVELSIEALSQNKIVDNDIENNANEVLILPDSYTPFSSLFFYSNLFNVDHIKNVILCTLLHRNLMTMDL